jgi:secernin
MCDTVVSMTEQGILFAKNSDRDPNEAQVVEWHPAADHPAGSKLRCSWIEIPHVSHTFAVVLSRPWWMWGAEMGANEHGVVIGNEAVFTKQPLGEPALLGMDILRLALERSSSAEDAVSKMVELIETYGQGGPCSFEHPKFTYHNSFLVADPVQAFVLETAGRSWATEEVRGPSRSISNGLTIPAFAKANADRLREHISQGALRRSRTETLAAGASGPMEMAQILRDHGTHGVPSWSLVNGALSAPCVHAGGLLVSTQTAASWIGDLRGKPLHWVTATAAPCTSIFKPVVVGSPVETGPPPTNRFDPAVAWWRHELLHRATICDLGGLLPRYSAVRDRTEASWFADPPPSSHAFEQAARLEEAWTADVVSAGVPDRRPWWLRRIWRRLDEAAGMKTARMDTVGR